MIPNEDNVLITICARGGSRGCPGKHTRNMFSKPLIVWTFEQANTWGRGRIIVSSDDEDIHRLSENHGIPWVWQRPGPTDTTPKLPAIQNALLDAERIFSQTFSTIIDLDATAPLRTIQHIENAYQKQCALGLDSCDCILSVVRDYGSWNCLKQSDHGLERVVSISANTRTRQQAPEWFRANASIYVYRREFLLREGVISPMDGWVEPYVMPEWTGYDVNSKLDFEIVEMLIKKMLTI